MTSLPLWHRDLTPELRRHAEATLGETTDRKAKALVDFRRLINEQENLYSRLDDVFLLRFLRMKKYDLQKAFKVFINYYNFRLKQKGVFTGKLPSDLKHIMDMNFMMYVPHRLPSGSHIGIYQMAKLDLQNTTVQEMVSTVFMVGEMVLDCEPTQVSGGVFILDLKDVTLAHYRPFLKFQFLSLVISMVQDCLPERINGVHILHAPAIFYAIFRLAKAVLKKKMVERVHFHGKDLNSLHKYIPKQYLPEDYGGTLGPFQNTELAKHFFASEAFIERINKYGFIKKM